MLPAAPLPAAFEMMVRLSYIALLLGWSLCLTAPATGHLRPQVPLTPPDTAAQQAVLLDGIAALEAERPAQAVAALKPLFQEEPGFYAPPHGSAAYWLGQAYAAAGQSGRAFATWAAGHTALDEADAFDARLADAFIRRVFEERNVARYQEATDAYLRLISRVGATRSPTEAALLEEHLAALAVILPEDLRQETGLAPGASDPAALKPGAGAALTAWWRGQDPVPATSENERLEEHLRRFVHAWAHYRAKGRLDDRGRIHLRLGAPYKKTSVDFTSSAFRRKVLNRNPALTAFGFRRNEFWVYPHVDYAAHYLFVEEKRGYYALGQPDDLLPSTLRMGFTSSARGQRKGAAYVRSMNEVYRQLALYHIDYSSRYQDAANYTDLLDMEEFSGRSARSPSDPAPATFAQTLLMRGRSEDRQNNRRRKKAVPTSYPGLSSTTAPLLVDVRLARFLDEDGTTRTEVYWSAPIQALRPPRDLLKQLDRTTEDFSERYLLAASIAQKGGDYQPHTVLHRRHLVNADATQEGGLLSPQTYTLAGNTGRFHLAVQWDEYVLYPDAPGVPSPRLGPHLRTATYRADSLTALRSDEGSLEMSDLKPLYLLGEQPTGAALAEAPPYPFERLTPETSLALYFEVYHLAFGPDDETRYSVAYEVFRRTERNVLKRLFRGDEEQRTTTQLTHTGRARTAEEYIQLDLSEWAAEGRLVVTVQVTDEVTGQQVERSIAFDLVPGVQAVAQ